MITLIVGDFKIFLVELLIVAAAAMIASRAFGCDVYAVLGLVFGSITAVSTVVLSIWVAITCNSNSIGFVFWIAVPMTLFGLLSLLAWEYPLEIAGIRLLMMLLGCYFVNFYSEIYGESIVLAVQYVLFGLYALSITMVFIDDW